jgi:CBS domain containing-hemolysin-like protein
VEDGIEELFGEIRDEYDSLEEVVQKISESEFLVSGGARLDEIEKETGISLGPGYNTISASVQEKLDRIPKVGASIEIEGVKVTVISMKGRRIEKIRLEKNLTQEKSCDIIK